jgi:hypothetical protein
MSQRAFGPSPGLGHLQRVELVAEDAHQFGSSRQARCRHHPFSALQTTRYPIHHDLPRKLQLNGSRKRWFQTRYYYAVLLKVPSFSQVLIDEFTQWNSLHEYGVAGT